MDGYGNTDCRSASQTAVSLSCHRICGMAFRSSRHRRVHNRRRVTDKCIHRSGCRFHGAMPCPLHIFDDASVEIGINASTAYRTGEIDFLHICSLVVHDCKYKSFPALFEQQLGHFDEVVPAVHPCVTSSRIHGGMLDVSVLKVTLKLQ